MAHKGTRGWKRAPTDSHQRIGSEKIKNQTKQNTPLKPQTWHKHPHKAIFEKEKEN
jgi:hypothetical protein